MPDRFGDEEIFHDPACRGGWLGENEAGQAVPCLYCKPHLAPRPPTDDTPNLSARARAAIAAEEARP